MYDCYCNHHPPYRKAHIRVPFGFKYDFDKSVCVPLKEGDSLEEQGHHLRGVYIQVPYEKPRMSCEWTFEEEQELYRLLFKKWKKKLAL